jgi:hypothetical protein
MQNPDSSLFSFYNERFVDLYFTRRWQRPVFEGHNRSFHADNGCARVMAGDYTRGREEQS